MLLAEPDEFLQKAADILTDYIIRLRKFLRRYPHPAVTPGQGAELDEDLPEIEESQEWEKLTPEVKTCIPVFATVIKFIQGDTEMS